MKIKKRNNDNILKITIKFQEIKFLNIKNNSYQFFNIEKMKSPFYYKKILDFPNS